MRVQARLEMGRNWQCKREKETNVITDKLMDWNVILTRVLCISEAACSSKKTLLVTVLALLAALAGCGDAHLPFLTTIQVSPAVPTIDIGQTQQFTAKGTYSDGSTGDLTSLVTWSSSNATVATISSSGLALSHSKGSSSISATFNAVGGPVTGSTTLNVVVTLTSLEITPVNPSIANSTSLQLSATGTFSDGSTQNLTASVSWTSSSNAIATVSSSGVLTGSGVGSATITATQAGVSGATTVTVTPAVLTAITITPPNSSIANGTSKQLIATGAFSDGTTQNLTEFVTWVSSAPSLVAVSNTAGSQGLVMGSAVGSATITATQAGVSGATTVTVTPAVLTAIVVTPANPSIANGTTKQLKATGAFSDGSTQDLTTQVSWTSSSGTMATVSSSGLVTGTGVGSATITATQAGVSGTTTVTVTPAVLTSIRVIPSGPSIASGTTKQLKAIGTFSDGTTQDLTALVTWASSAPSLADVSNAVGSQGLVTGIAAGSATITAALAGVSGATTLTVTPAVLTSIAVTPAANSIANGTTVKLIAIGTFSDGTTQNLTDSASWTSSSNAVAVVDNTPGNPSLVTGTGMGSATITATQEGVSGTATVMVTPAVLISIAVTPAAPSITKGITVQLTATGTFSDGTMENLTTSADWSSSSTTVATVDNTLGSPGLVTGTGVGSATITATQEGVSGATSVTVALVAFAYVTNDNDTDNTVSVFMVDPSTGALTAIPTSPFANPGRASVAVTADPSGRFLYTTNNSSDNVTAYNIVPSGANIGALTPISGSPFSTASGPFGIAVEPSGQFAYVVNQSVDTVSGFAIDASTGALTLISGFPFSTSPASHPSGVAVHPNDHFIYIAAWFPGQVRLYTFDPLNGALGPPGTPSLGPAPMLPESVTLDPMGRFAYTANIGGSSVSVYTVDSGTGVLTSVQNIPAGVGPLGGSPGLVAVDPSGRFAYVAGRDGVAGYSIDQTTGALTPVAGSPFPAGSDPRWVTVNPNGRFVYVANHGSATTPGGVSAYTIDLSTGALTQISGSPFPLPTGPSSITVVAVP
jgi:6-phosphogluconolactonase (cycloisomerase 2 family)